ncbi:GBF-interacting protein 1-like isoform X3 [Mangifera indica]|uniref:GBF-interacting protein 1-like isoform X3 n=1 Tax=Mangifera indica TaxID=29780 RepID=UPI001CFC0B46|nr:GBF-interacting protein 1-like isoform X3 [Mangifera indica]
MVTSRGSARIEGGTQILSAGVRKTIQTIKEIVGNHSDADIYVALKDSNMDPNETAQKLLNQDPFLEVKRRRDKKKESVGSKVSAVPRKKSENYVPMTKVRTFTDRNGRRGGYTRNALPDAGINREFRVVRDNRVNQNTIKEMDSPLPQCSTSTDDMVAPNAAGKGGPTGIPNSQNPSFGQSLSQSLNGPSDLRHRPTRDSNVGGTDRREAPDAKKTTVPGTVARVQVVKANNSQEQSATLALSNSVGVYFSSTDPVHVPSPDSRSSAAVGAIKREVGVVGGGRQSSENAAKDSSATSSSFSNSLLGRDNSSESFQPFLAISKADQLKQGIASGSGMSSIPVSRALFTNHYTGKSHQQAVGHQKASQHNKEWKPKLSQKSSVIGPGVIGIPTKSTSVPADNSKGSESDAAKLHDKLSRVNIYENQNVIIAQHIRVPETDRRRLTFGSFGVDFDSSQSFGSGFQAIGATEESNSESAASLSVAAPKSSADEVSGNKPVDILDDQIRNSGSDSPASGEASEHQLPDDIKETSSPKNLDNYGDVGLVLENNQSYVLSESQQQQDPSELASFSAYDPQTGYDMPYFRPGMDETVRGQGLPSPQESLASHTSNNIPASTITMVQQQQPPQMTQMYPQVHVSHYTNLMPYRQFISPLYVPQMAVPGYSSNPAYPHPSNGSSYLLMPGGSSPLSANGLKYGIQQFKPVPAGSPTGFGNFTSPTGYTINGPNVVGSAAGLEDSSRMKYKDGNLYVPNPQAETSELWIQNPRDLPGLQSAQYYNIPAQTSHPAYLPSHAGHASFSAAVPQSSHMQFPGMYHPTPQPAAMANPHHLGPAMGGNIGVGVAPAAPGAQVGAYQQPQLGNFNWTPNF